MNQEAQEAGSGGEIAVYESGDGDVRVDGHFDRETVWLSQRQMAEVFDTTPESVPMHLRNVFASGVLAAEGAARHRLGRSPGWFKAGRAFAPMGDMHPARRGA